MSTTVSQGGTITPLLLNTFHFLHRVFFFLCKILKYPQQNKHSYLRKKNLIHTFINRSFPSHIFYEIFSGLIPFLCDARLLFNTVMGTNTTPSPQHNFQQQFFLFSVAKFIFFVCGAWEALGTGGGGTPGELGLRSPLHSKVGRAPPPPPHRD